MSTTPARQGTGTAPSANDGRSIEHLTWPRMQELVDKIAAQADDDGAPETLIAVLRGGAVPAVALTSFARA